MSFKRILKQIYYLLKEIILRVFVLIIILSYHYLFRSRFEMIINNKALIKLICLIEIKFINNKTFNFVNFIM